VSLAQCLHSFFSFLCSNRNCGYRSLDQLDRWFPIVDTSPKLNTLPCSISMLQRCSLSLSLSLSLSMALVLGCSSRGRHDRPSSSSSRRAASPAPPSPSQSHHRQLQSSMKHARQSPSVFPHSSELASLHCARRLPSPSVAQPRLAPGLETPQMESSRPPRAPVKPATPPRHRIPAGERRPNHRRAAPVSAPPRALLRQLPQPASPSSRLAVASSTSQRGHPGRRSRRRPSPPSPAAVLASSPPRARSGEPLGRRAPPLDSPRGA
jgi:hypothetical protein